MKWKREEVNNSKRGQLNVRRTEGNGPGAKWGHTCNAVKKGRLMYLFGGYGAYEGPVSDVHVFDTTTKMWSKLMVEGAAPCPRYSHTCTTVGKKLFVFGGTDRQDPDAELSPLNDLHILDTDSNCWISATTTGEGPAAREGHSAARIGTNLLVFGGLGRSPEGVDQTYFNDVYILDTLTLTWTQPVTYGISPPPRAWHTCSSYLSNVIVLGGEGSTQLCLSDVHILDIDTMVWKELRTTGQMLTPRAAHTTVALGKNLLVLGGSFREQYCDDLHVLNVESGLWTKETTTGEGPSGRDMSAGDCVDPNCGILLFFGGYNENQLALDDLYYLDYLDKEPTDALLNLFASQSIGREKTVKRPRQ